MCPCPAHADSTPSLSIRQGNQGILVTCFAGCDREDVLRELRRVPSRGRFAYTDTPTARSGNAERLWDEALLSMARSPSAIFACDISGL
jgi:hypothetical protein